MANFLYVHNSNVWIEGIHVAAVTNGLAPDIWTAHQHKICGHSWRMDFGRLLQFAGGDPAEIGCAVLYGSKPPPNDSLWAAAERSGFKVVVHERSKFSGREKKVDANIATDITADSYELMQSGRDKITLLTGDADYVPTIQRLRARGPQFDVCFWDHAAKELQEASSSFISLNQHLDHLRLK